MPLASQLASVNLAGVGGLGLAPGVLTTTIWFFPFLLAAIAYYQRTVKDPERQPVS